MRNLKRVLALAMAMVMILGMMVIGSSAASYSDAAAIDEEYAVAVEVLSGMGVFKGTGAGFAPKQILTRAEAATLIYRVITGDVKDAQTQNYDYASLKDIQAGQWFTGYVTYANNGGYIKGDDLGNFNPYQQVTGIQVMAIMLRAAGYGQNGEYEGAAWKDNILTDGFELGITGKISTATLNAPATRELVAQLIFNAITSVKMVSYAPLLGYYKAADAETLAEKVFDLATAADEDIWGRPAAIWFADKNGNEKKDVKEALYASLPEAPIAVYTEAVSECDVAKDMGLKKDTTVKYYDNGYATTEKVEVLKQPKTLGGQGVQIEVYEDRIVRIDTYLAQVGVVTPEKTDKNGHVKQEAFSKVTVFCYDLDVATGVKTNEMSSVDFAKDDMILVNVNYTEGVIPVQLAESFDGSQDKIWNNARRHTIDDVDYFDAEHFHLNEAGISDAKYTWFLDQFGNLIGSVEIAATYNYAVLKDIIWNVGRPGSAEATIVYMDGTEDTVIVENADEHIIYDDDDWAWSVDTEIYLDDEADMEFGGVSTDSKYNDDYLGYALYKVEYNKNGSVNLHGAMDNSYVVYYEADANIDTSSSVILDLDGDKVFVTTKTQFLVREGNAQKGYTYAAYDIDTLPEFEDNCEIFFTVNAKTGVAERVYIKNAVLEAEFGNYLFVITDEYYTLTGRNAGKFHMQVLVDGVERDIVTDWGTVSMLADNVGKLFFADFETWADSRYYGSLEDAYIVNEDSDEDAGLWGENYMAHDIMVNNGIIVDDYGISYRFDADTKVYGDIDSIDELTQAVVNEKGIWVIADYTSRYGRAAAIYVGTKLSENEEIVKVNVKNGTIDLDDAVVTIAEGKTEAEVTVFVNDYDLIVIEGEDDDEIYFGSYTFEVADGDTIEFTVYPEAGCHEGESYEWSVVAADATEADLIKNLIDSDNTETVVYNGDGTCYADIADAVANVKTIDAGTAENVQLMLNVSEFDAVLYRNFTTTADIDVAEIDTDIKDTGIIALANPGEYIAVVITVDGADWYAVFTVA